MAAGDREDQNASTGELLRQLSEQMSALVRQELELARAEMSAKVKAGGIGAGLFGGAGLFAVYGLGAVIAAAIAALATGLATWLAALIVAVVLFAIAGVAALIGKKEVSQAVPPAPERTIDSIKTDVQVTKERAQKGRS
jgi:uncharacterized membrane protein YqjE